MRRLGMLLALLLLLAAPARAQVVLDDASSTEEEGMDATVTLNHTAGGASNRAVFASCGGFGTGSGPTTTSITYGGTPMTEMWDVTTAAVSNAFLSGYYLAIGATLTGAQAVVCTVNQANPEIVWLTVISFTGVDQATPVGTSQTFGASQVSPWSVTVGSVGATDFVVDTLIAYGTGTPAVGANQTQQETQVHSGGTLFMAASTQAGADGGVMSWTETGSIDGILGAVNFKAAAAGGTTPRGPLIGVLP